MQLLNGDWLAAGCWWTDDVMGWVDITHVQGSFVVLPPSVLYPAAAAAADTRVCSFSCLSRAARLMSCVFIIVCVCVR